METDDGDEARNRQSQKFRFKISNRGKIACRKIPHYTRSPLTVLQETANLNHAKLQGQSLVHKTLKDPPPIQCPVISCSSWFLLRGRDPWRAFSFCF